MHRTRSQCPEGDISTLSSPSRTSADLAGTSFRQSQPQLQSQLRSTYQYAHTITSSRFSHPRPAPLPPTSPASRASTSTSTSTSAAASPTSPVIARSAFAHLDYFGPPRPTGSPLVQRSKTIATGTPVYHPTMPESHEIDLASPRVLASPEVKQLQRRSVQLAERSHVNWARPLRYSEQLIDDRPVSSSSSGECGHGSQQPAKLIVVRLLGTSMQRSRRLAKSPSLDTPSPCSSLDEAPLTPSTPDSHSAPSHRSWTLPTVSEVKGLGFGNEVDWSASSSESGSALADYLESNTSTPSRGTPTPRHSRIISTSESLVELSSPSTLDELRHLRQAALDLQAQAAPLRHVEPTETIRARRIKRKAVPSIDVHEAESRSRSSPELASVAAFSKPMRVISTVIPPPSSSPSLSSLISPTVSGTGTTRRPFYANVLATRSVTDMSPRTYVSTHQRMASHQSSSCSSASDTDEPITPGATTERDAFVHQVEAGLRALNMSSIDLGSFSDESRKHKRGISRFFRKNPSEI